MVNDNGAVSEFFLVPYFGACIHVPPPAAEPDRLRQIGERAIRLAASEDAYWVTGTLHTRTTGTSLARAALHPRCQPDGTLQILITVPIPTQTLRNPIITGGSL